VSEKERRRRRRRRRRRDGGEEDGFSEMMKERVEISKMPMVLYSYQIVELAFNFNFF